MLNDGLAGGAIASDSFPGKGVAANPSNVLVVLGVDSNCKAGTQVAFGERLLNKRVGVASLVSLRRETT